MAPKGWQQIVAVLGVAQAGGSFMGIDPALPALRSEMYDGYDSGGLTQGMLWLLGYDIC